MLCQLLLCVGYFIGTTVAHVALTYPPARKYDLDFLDNGRTKAPCGMPKGDLVTSLPAASGAMINITWHLAYPHRGGFKLELLDQNERYLRDLTPTDATTEYVGSDDTTAQSYTVSFPESLKCKGCTLRLLRQAQEWGHQYLFWSCADVDIVPVTELTTVCSGHGKTNANGQCQCDHLYSGVVCQYKDECWDDNDCSSHGKCINIEATSYPQKQCYCEIGWFGERCSKESPVKDVNIDTSKYTKRELSDEFTLLWRIIPESEEIEAVMRIKGTNYAAIGWRPHGITQSCKSFPIVQNENLSKGLEPSPRHATLDSSKQNVLYNSKSKHIFKVQSEPTSKLESKAESETKLKPELKAEGKAEPEPQPIPNGEPESKAENKAEPEPKAESKVEPETKAESKVEPEPKAESKAEPEPKAEVKAEPEPKAEVKAEPEPKGEVKAEPEPEAKIIAEPEPKTEVKAESEPKAEPEPKAEAKAEPEPKAEVKAEAKTEPEPKAEAKAEPEPKAEAKAEPEPKAEANAEPEPNAKSKTGPELKTNSEHEQQSHYNRETNADSFTKFPVYSKKEQESTAEPFSKAESNDQHKIVSSLLLQSSPSKKLFADSSSLDTHVLSAYSTLNTRSRRQITIRTSDFILKDPLPVSLASPEPLPEISAEPTSTPESSKITKHSVLPEPHIPVQLSVIKSPNSKLSKSEPEPEPEDGTLKHDNNIAAYHSYPSRTPFTPKADFHAMDCTDIVIGRARGSLSRIQDFYTRDRSTPRVDSFFGGKDDITAALGFEVDGTTTILFRKRLKANDMTDHTITDNPMDVIWARGQEPNMYIHSPTTGLEAGKAKITDFYRLDELKYHGHGSQRGKLVLNFFEEKKMRDAEQSDCQGQWRYPASCQEKQCEYSIKWKFLDTTDEVSFTITSTHPDRWTGIGFSKDQRMPQTDAVIGWVDHIGRATILDVWMSDYVPPKLDKSQDIYNISGERKDGVTTLHFVRKRFTIDFDNDIHFSDTDCPYLIFPVNGGTFNAISKKIGKHEVTPVVSSEKVCIRKCHIRGSKIELVSKPKPESEPEPGLGSMKPIAEPTVEPEPKSEPTLITVSEPEPKSVSGRNFISSCLGEWKFPPNCEGHNCEYKANWFYIDETDEIIFTISSKSYNKWTGIGFSKNRAMTETDAVIGWIEETGRSFIMDTWLESYSPPILDTLQNIHNASGQRVDGMTVLQFVRKRGTNDVEKDLQFKDDCLYFIYPVRGGVFNAVNKKIRKHESTPIVSSKKICIHSCRSKAVPTTSITQPTTERIQTSIYSETFTTKQQIMVDSTSMKTLLLAPTTQPTVSFPSSKYSVEVKLRHREKGGLRNKNSQQYQTLQKQLLQEMNTALQKLVELKAVELTGFESDEAEQDVIARMVVTLSDQIPLKEGRNLHTDKTGHKASGLHSILNSAINTGRLGNLPVDPAYLNIVSLEAVQDKSPQEHPVEQESSSNGLTDEQVKIYIIISGVLALVFLVIVQAACMIYRDRRTKRGSHTKEKLLNNSHWKDYSVTASSNYSYENFAMQDDENKISKHPIGSVSNGSGLSKGSAVSQPTNGLGLPRVGPPDRMLPRNTGYSATFERMAMRRNNGPPNTSIPPSYATHDRSLRSMSGSAQSQQELRPDFYFMPHQRRYSGEVVRVFVDYNNPEYTGK